MLREQARERNKMDPRVRRTRQLLQAALVALMQEKSFRVITVQDIADRATVNRVTFYAHFDNKEALLEYTVREMIRRRLRSRIPESSLFNPESVARLIQTVCEFLAEMDRQCPPPHGWMETLMEKQIKAEVFELLRGWLAERSAGEQETRPAPEQVAMITTWAIYGAAVQWSQSDRRRPAEEFVQQVLPLILASLQPLASLLAPSMDAS
jgi:AcrR family transcriptional regulator